jgi:hypothetical protein
MPLGIRLGHNRMIDREICWKVYLQTSSVYKVPKILKEEYGIINKKTGKMISPQGVFTSLGMYIIENMSEARKQWETSQKENGVVPTEKEWYRFLLSKAKYLTPTRFEQFLEQNSYLKPYLEQMPINEYHS